MLYYLSELGDWAVARGWTSDLFKALNVFSYITFRSICAGVTAFVLSLLFGNFVIRKLISLKFGQPIRTAAEVHKLYELHGAKKGTPTMGGIIFILAAIFGYLMAHLISGTPTTASALLVIGLVVGLGFVGFLDDWLKVSRQNSRGLKGRYKLLAQASLAGVFGYAGLQFADQYKLTPISQYLSTVKETSIYLGTGLVIAFVILMVMSASNGVNLTDGLDGLATGATIMTFLAFVLIGVWALDEAQLKNFTTYGALLPIVIGLVVFKFAVSAMVRSIVLIVALALGGLVYSQRSEISDCVDSAKANAESSLGKVQCKVLGFTIDLDLQDQVP